MAEFKASNILVNTLIPCHSNVSGRQKLKKLLFWDTKRHSICLSSRRKSLVKPGRSGIDPKNVSNENISDRISKAREYLKNKNINKSSSSSPPPQFSEDKLKDETTSNLPGQKNIAVPEPERPEFSERKLSNEEFQAKFNTGGAAGDMPIFRKGEKDAGVAEKMLERERKVEGSAEEPAQFLKIFASRANSLDKILMGQDKNQSENIRDTLLDGSKRPEVEIISVDKSYKPKVSSWGVFPRPSNISEAYGGGRTIDPSVPLETEEERKRKDEEIEETLKTYRIKMGLEIEPKVKEEFDRVYGEGMKYFNKGYLPEAFEKFDQASKLVNFKTKYAGDALYQKALCLDSSGRSSEAKVIYQELLRHTNPNVRKEAKKMIFSFRAMDELKTHTISYSNPNDFSKYFNKIESKFNSSYMGESSADSSELEKDVTNAFMFSIAIILTPLIILAFLVFHRYG